MTSSLRALRVGVLLGDNLVEERVFLAKGDAAPVTLGHSLRCQLSLPIDGLPAMHVLFTREQGRFVLRPVPGMRVIGVTGTDPAALPIGEGARGRLAIGEATLLFQEIAAPAIAPRLPLPAALRATFGDRIDRRLAVIVGGSLVVHLAIGAWAWVTEVEEPVRAEAPLATAYRQDTYAITLPDDPVIADPMQPSAPGAATPVAPVQTPRAIVPAPRVAMPGRPPVLPTASDADRFAQILTGSDPARGGPGEMRGRLPGADLGQQLADIRDGGRTVRVGSDTGGFRSRDREGVGDGATPRIDAPSGLAQQRPEERGPRGRIDLRPTIKPDPSGTLTAAVLLAKIQRDYLPGLQRCYKQGLATDATLGGKVAVAFTVDERGRVSAPSARGLTAEVDRCITNQMTSWRFPLPKDADGDPTDVDFGLSLALVPGS
ncbi:MAG: AgmX/PglI C-terminal domain-containing protein [Myxococcota bacterium]|nr:AgmX/PglI C-terminal domain-containing protein [Myxococcota bacterium]